MASPQVRTPVGNAPVIPLGLIMIGAWLAFFGVHYWRSDIAYPTTPIKDVLQGKGLPAATQTPTADEQAVVAAAQQLAGSQGVTPGTGESNPNAVGQAGASGSPGMDPVV